MMKTTEQSIVEVTFSFLVSGPMFHVRLPADFDPVPELNSPLYNGVGGRDFTFHPKQRDIAAEGYVFLGTTNDRDGRLVELFERIEPPPIWWLRWPLSAGSLYTHLREEDGADMLAVTASSISVIESADGLPFVLPYSPLAVDMVRVNGFVEEVSYFSQKRGSRWRVTFQRPGFLLPGQVEVAPTANTGGSVLITIGIGAGSEAIIMAGESLSSGEDVARLISDSFAEAEG
jgi:hypothetical protein